MLPVFGGISGSIKTILKCSLVSMAWDVSMFAVKLAKGNGARKSAVVERVACDYLVSSCQRLIEIGNYVSDIFNADRDTDHVLRDSGRGLLYFT